MFLDSGCIVIVMSADDRRSVRDANDDQPFRRTDAHAQALRPRHVIHGYNARVDFARSLLRPSPPENQVPRRSR